ncbi:MAG: NAD-dependent epimerase/dehydratase family protein [Aquificaceae bacterium]|nr:NAD-dependent epimerase/dehydratase family protein [Aquificaceae bacterium]MDW8237141.1 NAD-dependent epimerase/dehydratase family protein [Aquificaceae bacterium]
MKSVFITGAGGYVGCVLVPELLSRNYRVFALDRFFFGKEKLPKHENLTLIQEDARCYPKELLKDVDFVIDLVAISNDPSGERFEKQTWQINHLSRVRTAKFAKEMGVKRYILASSCSIYGFQSQIVNENSPTNPLTTYAKANELAEKDTLKLADSSFCVVALRQATLFGFSNRMRFDLAINGMTYGAFKNSKLPLMRDGTQFRPFLHVKDSARAMIHMLEFEDSKAINGQIFNVGKDNYQLKDVATLVANEVQNLTGKEVSIEFYGDPDRRSYMVSFEKIKQITNFEPEIEISQGVREIVQKLLNNEIDKTTQTITLEWYTELERWHKLIKDLELRGGILSISECI